MCSEPALSREAARLEAVSGLTRGRPVCERVVSRGSILPLVWTVPINIWLYFYLQLKVILRSAFGDAALLLLGMLADAPSSLLLLLLVWNGLVVSLWRGVCVVGG